MNDRQSITPEEAIDQIYQFGGRVLGRDISDVSAQADKVKSIFGKARKLGGYVKDIANVLALLKDYASGAYTQVPWRIIAALTGALFYVFSPADLIPDLIPLFGFADDATVFAAVMSFAQMDLAAYLAWKFEKGEVIEGGGQSGVMTIDKRDDITDWSLTDFVQVIQNALASIGNSGLRWYYGEPYISQNATNIHQKIMGGKGNIGDVIGVIDMEAFQHSKEGFAFARDGLYFRQFMGNSFSFTWREIMSIQYEGKELIINGVRLDNMCRDENDAKTICKVLLAVANRADLTPEPAPYDEARYVPINEAIVKRFASVDNGGMLFVGKNIPDKKRKGAHQAMNIQEPPEDICLLFDNSLLGNGKSGFAFTSKARYFKEGFFAPARQEWGIELCVANPDNIWFMGSFPGQNPPSLYYQISGGTLNPKQISAIVDAINEFQMYHLKETGRSVEAKCKSVLEQINDCEKAIEQAAHSEISATEDQAITKVEAQGATVDVIENKPDEHESALKTKKKLIRGRKVIEATVVEDGCVGIRNGRYYLDETITIKGDALLNIKDADFEFGPSGAVVFAGGKGDISNCRFQCAEEATGRVMFSGFCKWVGFNSCDFDGNGQMACALLDGDTSFFRCRIKNLTNKNQAGTVLGTPFVKGGSPKLSIKSTSIENCSAASQAVVWAMDLNIRDCEFVNCSSPNSIITVAEDCSVTVRNVVFDHCSVGAGGAVVGFYSNGGSNQTGGIGIDNCLIKNSTYQYASNVNIPLAFNNWVSEDVYRGTPDDPLRPIFLRDGSQLKKQIGATLNLSDEVEVVLESENSKSSTCETKSGMKKTRKSKEICKKAKDKDAQQEKGDKVLYEAKPMARSGHGKVAPKLSDAKESNKTPTNSSSIKKAKISTAMTVERDNSDNIQAGKTKDKNFTSREEAKKGNAGQNSKANRKARKMSKNETKTEKKSESGKLKPSTVQKVSLESAIKTAVAKSGDQTNIYVGTSIPAKKLNNAIASMGVRVGEDVYALIDTTIFGSAKSGLVFTSEGIRWHNDWMQTNTIKTALTWSEINNVIVSAHAVNNDLVFSEDAIVSLAGSSIAPKNLKSILRQIVELAS